MKLNASFRTIFALIFLVLAVRFWEQYSVDMTDTAKMIGTMTITVLGVFVLVVVSRKKEGE